MTLSSHSDAYEPGPSSLRAPTRSEAERDLAEDRRRPLPERTPAQAQADEIAAQARASLAPELRGRAPWASVRVEAGADHGRPGVYRVILGETATPGTQVVVTDALLEIYGASAVQATHGAPVVWVKTDRTPSDQPPF